MIAPNVITPNEDQVNDVYSLEVTNASDVHLVILNRWGNVVFEQNGLNPAWDGTSPNGKKVQEGTYFYKYVITGVDESIPPLEGHGFIQVVID
ncbi:MAG: gliding motility-associated C-terminal domain-containing protein [Crocinitomicaceae bacterium]|nr:gliding motility-associated C-terminal domain-containing protein [Crocinitomicaceae bacterium]